MDAWELLEAQRYSESIAAYRARLKANADDWPAIAGLACALRAGGDYGQALPLFKRVDEYERSGVPGRPGRRLDLSVLYWLSGDLTRAVDAMRSLVNGVLDGSIEFGDLAGGAKQGLLLHYMGVTMMEQTITNQALDYLRKLARNDRIRQWPGPVALFILGLSPREDMLPSAERDSDRQSILLRRKLCVALFHDGAYLRAKGAEQECLQRMRACRSLQDPIVEPEWYLARHEIEHPLI